MIRADRFFLAVVVFLGGACLAYGQAVSVAEASGVVADPSGSAIAGAQVRMTETDKQQSRAVATDQAGHYTLSNLPVGPYRLEVSAPGFKGYVQSGIELQVGNNVQINVTMQVGSVSESIEVTASAGMVETKETTISQVIDEKRIVDLPLNGRQPTQLVLLSGAAITAPGGGMTGTKSFFSSTTISVAGGQANGVNYLLDGGDNNDAFSNVNLPIPFPDALQEFSVQTSSLPARFGLHPGGVVNAVTKSGSNGWHGDAFEFLRNGDFNARNFFAPAHDTLKRNQFGGTFGGRILRDRLFFFGGYQGTRNRSDPPQTVSFVPTPAVLRGDFSTIDSGTCVSGGKGKTLTDPVTGQPFPNNQIPLSRLNPQALSIVNKYIPISNDPCGKLTYGIPTTGDENQIIGRIDWVQNAKHSLYGRYFTSGYVNPPTFDGKNLLTTTVPGNDERAQTLTLADTFAFSGSTLNSFHATATRRRDNRGVSSKITNPAAEGLNVASPLPNFLQIAISNYFSVGCGTCAPGHFNVNSFHYADDVDVIRGKHQMAFGVYYLRNQMNVINGYIENGSWTANGQTTNDALADYLLGIVSDFTQSNPLQNATRATVFALYAQDSVRLTPHLTVNAGIRWEPSFPAYDYFANGDSFSPAGFAAGQISKVHPNAPPGLFFYKDPGIPKAYSNGHTWLFSPRAGIVWDPSGTGKQTLRVSGAILRDTAELFYPERLTTNPPYASAIDIPSPTGGLTNPFQGYPGGNPFPGSSLFPAAYGVYVNMPLTTKPTYMVQWNASYQRQITANWLGSVSYLGNKTTHLWVGEDINPSVFIPGTCSGKPCSSTSNTNQRRPLYLQNPVTGSLYSSLVQSDQNGNSNYNGMLASIQHRFSGGFTLLTNYTWSHCISDVDFTGELAGSQYMNPANRAQDRGRCNFDVRHIFNSSLIFQSPMRGSGLAGKILKDWQLAPIVQARSGIALNVTLGKDISLTGVGLDRPNQILQDQYFANRTPAAWINPAAYATPATGTFGNLGRDTISGPVQINFDMSLTRTFPIMERFRLEARAEAFNAINHANFSNPSTNLSSSNFGRILTAGDPRILQFAMKLHF